MADRPKRLHTSNSFTRMEKTPESTLQSPPMPAILDPLKVTATPEEEEGHADGDVFASKEDEEEQMEHQNVPEGFEELPIEIRSLTERFLESLSAKVHPSPLSADRLSDLFQDFYTRASGKINTHIATLSARLNSDSYKKTSASSRPGSVRSISGESGEQQMLSASEMADRKKARKLLEVKRVSLEEAAERAVCEKVYDRIWRHRSTDDEERDHKLRSRTAALSLVGIGLKELLMTAEEFTEEERRKTKEREGEIREWLSTARDDILLMSEEKYPLGKLRHLTAAHKSIVEALSKIFPASSSADEILPTLIYTLITLEPSRLNAYSDLKFIQRFRGSTRMDGETAYCLVNLEAAVSFLETVDLSSLRAEEPGPKEKTGSRPPTPQKSEITPMPLGLAQAPDLTQTPATPTSSLALQQPPSPGTKAQRRLSNLIQTQTNRIEAASDAVKESILDSADQALGRINNTLDTSFKFLFGRMKDRDPNSPVQEPVELPKTLEDARKLVSSPTRLETEDDTASVSGASSIHGEERGEEQGRPDLQARMTDLFGGRRQLRDRSVDSTQSGGSGKRVAFDAKPPPIVTKSEAIPPQPNASAVDSLRNMGNSLNPLNRFASINVIPRFGRTVSQSTTPNVGTPTSEANKQLPAAATVNRSPSGEAAAQVDDKGARAIAAIEALKKTTPPVKRFLEAKDSQDLKLKEVDELLKEYQRLAIALKGTINH
ncbi:uncharacterized protein N0V89_008507 [Didymosphaeria variabile]|uniref:VPS9 domain-containing protein n=1 Tax=Didymosphaeria variabile TaxID=1932322 RepID=A0A9W8XGK2_9PLEO|nr:uncharacterized protein N0V89_008507 [Didymosphaeria variabile]KAJ4349888.1 hypothetical protein N0V89_008507 [Didymosphaeria variabile]